MGVQLTQEMISGAIATQKKYGVPASVTLAQILQESGGSNPGGLSTLAYKYNNLFGIKAGSSWDGETVNMSTGEHFGGGQVTIKDNFRVYGSVQESIEDHGKLLTKPWYTKYTSSATNADEYARAIHKAGYATDPNYSNSLISLMKQYNLYQYDSGQIGGVVDTSGGSTTGTQTGWLQDKWAGIKNNIFVLIIVIVLLVAGALFLAGAFIDSPKKEVEKVAKKVIAKKAKGD